MKNRVILSLAFLCLSVWLTTEVNGASLSKPWSVNLKKLLRGRDQDEEGDNGEWNMDIEESHFRVRGEKNKEDKRESSENKEHKSESSENKEHKSESNESKEHKNGSIESKDKGKNSESREHTNESNESREHTNESSESQDKSKSRESKEKNKSRESKEKSKSSESKEDKSKSSNEREKEEKEKEEKEKKEKEEKEKEEKEKKKKEEKEKEEKEKKKKEEKEKEEKEKKKKEEKEKEEKEKKKKEEKEKEEKEKKKKEEKEKEEKEKKKKEEKEKEEKEKEEKEKKKKEEKEKEEKEKEEKEKKKKEEKEKEEKEKEEKEKKKKEEKEKEEKEKKKKEEKEKEEKEKKKKEEKEKEEKEKEKEEKEKKEKEEKEMKEKEEKEKKKKEEKEKEEKEKEEKEKKKKEEKEKKEKEKEEKEKKEKEEKKKKEKEEKEKKEKEEKEKKEKEEKEKAEKEKEEKDKENKDKEEDDSTDAGDTCYSVHYKGQFDGYELIHIYLNNDKNTSFMTKDGPEKTLYKFIATEKGKGIRIDCESFRLGMNNKNSITFSGRGLRNEMTESEFKLEFISESHFLQVIIDTIKKPLKKVQCIVTLTNEILPEPPIGCVCGKRNHGPPGNSPLPGPPEPSPGLGQGTKVHEFPYLSGLTYLYDKKPICGGAIIYDTWIATTASCAIERKENNTCATVGEHNWNVLHETTKTSWKNIEEIIIHPDYNPGSPLHDIALLKLKRPIKFTTDNKVAPICLPEPQNGALAPGTKVLTMGWGQSTQVGPQSPVVRKVYLEVTTKEICTASYGPIVDSDYMICAIGEKNKGPCRKDMGGPLIQAEGERDELFGLASLVWLCGNDEPIIFTKVANYVEWIYYVTGKTAQC